MFAQRSRSEISHGFLMGSGRSKADVATSLALDPVSLGISMLRTWIRVFAETFCRYFVDDKLSQLLDITNGEGIKKSMTLPRFLRQELGYPDSNSVP